MGHLAVLHAHPHQRCRAVCLLWAFSEKWSSLISQALFPRAAERREVGGHRDGLAGGWCQGHRAGSTRRGLRGCMRAIARKGTRVMAITYP